MCLCGPYLTPHQHGAKDDLEAVEEVVPDDDDGGPPCGPALAGADGFDAGCRCKEGTNVSKGLHRCNESLKGRGRGLWY